MAPNQCFCEWDLSFCKNPFLKLPRRHLHRALSLSVIKCSKNYNKILFRRWCFFFIFWSQGVVSGTNLNLKLLSWCISLSFLFFERWRRCVKCEWSARYGFGNYNNNNNNTHERRESRENSKNAQIDGVDRVRGLLWLVAISQWRRWCNSLDGQSTIMQDTTLNQS